MNLYFTEQQKKIYEDIYVLVVNNNVAVICDNME